MANLAQEELLRGLAEAVDDALPQIYKKRWDFSCV